MEVQIQEPPGRNKPLVSCREGQASYKSQISETVQQQYSECKKSPTGFKEGSSDPSYCQKDIAKEMYDALETLSKKIHPRNKLTMTSMCRTVASHFRKLATLTDQFDVVGDKVKDKN